jgi:transcription-repair coupling factor (superfamily II helicase)
VIDDKTVYLRMPPTFLEAETLLMVLRNLLRSAYDREHSAPLQAAAAGAATR